MSCNKKKDTGINASISTIIGKITVNGSSDIKLGGTVVSAHHAARRYVRAKNGKIIIDKNAGLLYHDDSGVEELAKKIIVAIDWTRPDKD